MLAFSSLLVEFLTIIYFVAGERGLGLAEKAIYTHKHKQSYITEGTLGDTGRVEGSREG